MKNVLAFKQNTAARVDEIKRQTKRAVGNSRKKRKAEPMLFHNGTPQKLVKLFGIIRRPTRHLTQADIDAIPVDHIPTYSNQYAAKVMRLELRRGFWRRLRDRLSRR